jgi:hypothetical protein
MNTKSSERINHWQSHIKQWHSSGQTQADYCRHHDLKLHQFTYWRSKLKTDHDSEAPADCSDTAFIPVTLESQSSSGLVLCLPNGYRIEGITSGEMEQVSRLLEVLK